MAIAQMNWGRLKYLLEDKRMIEFSKSLNEVYSLAENHPGFIWRIPNNQLELQLSNLGFDKLISSTVSVWKDIESLKDYTYNSLHGVYLKRSSEWFQKIDGLQLVIWNAKNDDQPTVKESFDRLEYLQNNGPTDYAYAWTR
jgi:hypothetical protein